MLYLTKGYEEPYEEHELLKDTHIRSVMIYRGLCNRFNELSLVKDRQDTYLFHDEEITPLKVKEL